MAFLRIRAFLFLSIVSGAQILNASFAPRREVVERETVVVQKPEAPKTHTAAPPPPVKNDPVVKEGVDPTLPPSQPAPKVSLPTQGQIQDRNAALIKLAERLADLYACVPGHKESDYSTQSWYLVDSFRAWNNAVAVSVFSNSDNASLGLEDFEKAFLDRIKQRVPALAKDQSVKDYAKIAALATQNITQKALKDKSQVKDFSEASTLVRSSAYIDHKNIFQFLKTAHQSNVETLKKNTCANLGVAFFESPKFGVPSTSESVAASAKTKKNAAIDKGRERSDSISAELPFVKFEDRNKHGYYSAGKFQAGRPHIIANILKAATELKAKGLSMGVADINAKGNSTADKKVKTPGYSSRDKGKKATFLTLGSDGNPKTCGFKSQTCYDPIKTFQMVQALIDQDPDNIRRIEVADKNMREWIEDYLVKKHGYKSISADWVVRDNHEFDMAINIEWKE